MPLRQSTLNFSKSASSPIIEQTSLVQTTMMRSTRQSPADIDTIVVDTTDIQLQLPTPADSATDASSEASQPTVSEIMPRSRSKRVSSATGRKSAFRENLDATNGTDREQNSRSLSGETLVAKSMRRSRADDSAMTCEALDMAGLQKSEDGVVMGKQDAQDDQQETSSVITVREESEDEKVREERRLAKQKKMQDNAKKWEARKKVAEKNATRRSGRASLITKAGDIIDNIKNTVLGKRPRHASEKDTDPKSSSNGADLSGPMAKRARLDEDDAVAQKPLSKKTSGRRDKKWLTSGLFAGQPRMFDARLTENKNKRKSKASQDTHTKENSVLPLPMFAGERLLQYGRDFKLPFDVFSPLPAGQPKPDEWKKVNKNVFVGDAAEQWRIKKYAEHSRCICNVDNGCDQDCMNRYMYYECDEGNCVNKLIDCGNRAFEGLKQRTKLGGKYNVGVEVIKTEDRGYGVRSNRSFMPNQIIVEYTGEIITQEECEHRMRTIYKNNACYYLMLFDQNMIIDATRGSIARFVNHSCEPNCRMEKWTVQGKPRMALFAGDRGIMTGEELTYDYNFDPYSQKNVQECKCGAPNCRGVLGPKPKPETKRSSPENDLGKKKEGSKRKALEAPGESKNQANKKRKPSGAQKSKSPTQAKARAGSRSPKKSVLVKKAARRTASGPKATTKLGRSDSKLKKLIATAKGKAGSLKARRVVSASSGTTTLLEKKAGSVSRSSSLKEKARIITQSARARSKTISVAT